MLFEGSRTEWVDFEYQPSSGNPSELAAWLVSTQTELEKVGAQNITWGIGDFGDSIGVQAQVTTPITEEDRKDIQAWLEANPEQPPQVLRFKKPIDFVDRV